MRESGFIDEFGKWDRNHLSLSLSLSLDGLEEERRGATRETPQSLSCTKANSEVVGLLREFLSTGCICVHRPFGELGFWHCELRISLEQK